MALTPFPVQLHAPYLPVERGRRGALKRTTLMTRWAGASARLSPPVMALVKRVFSGRVPSVAGATSRRAVQHRADAPAPALCRAACRQRNRAALQPVPLLRPTNGKVHCSGPYRLSGGLILYTYAPNPLGYIDLLGLTETSLVKGAPFPDGTKV